MPVVFLNSLPLPVLLHGEESRSGGKGTDSMAGMKAFSSSLPSHPTVSQYPSTWHVSLKNNENSINIISISPPAYLPL